jgi:glycosyltransferase involved in cell wall biosynthesis
MNTNTNSNTHQGRQAIAVSSRRPTTSQELVLHPFTVIIPTYNEESGIEHTLAQLHQSLEGIDVPYEIIVVNDGSTDGTGELLRSRRDICLIEHPWNKGYGAALKTGIRNASYPLIVITDADGTYPNEVIPHLVRLADQADMVVGARTGASVHIPWLRRIPKWFLARFAEWMARQPIPDLNSGLRVFKKSVAERFLNILPNSFSFTTTITLAMLTNNYNVYYEAIDYYPRKGKSKIKPIKDTIRFLQLILRTGMYFAPLRCFLPVAAAFFTAFLITFCQDVVNWNLTQKTLILFVAAVQLTMFALLADMIDKRSG